MIEIEIDIRQPELDLCLPAERDSLPVVRQALRALGEAVGADLELLEDAELAITEACANAIEHAYGDGPGAVGVMLRPQGTEMAVTVRDRGRGIPATVRSRNGHGFGLSMIEGIATDLDIQGGPDHGTDVVMSLTMSHVALSLNGSAHPTASPVERMARRLVAVIAAQTDMPSDRLVESLLAIELAAHHAPRYLIGNRIHFSLERLGDGFDVGLGPLTKNGARALVQESDLPGIGPVIERLCDQVTVEAAERGPSGERLWLRMSGR